MVVELAQFQRTKIPEALSFENKARYQNLRIILDSLDPMLHPSVPTEEELCEMREKAIYESEQPSRRPGCSQFCTQKCLLGLKNDGELDERCPNVALHRQDKDSKQHPINATGLIQLLEQELDESSDGAIHMGTTGSCGAPFKLTCKKYGYTVLGKATTCSVWADILGEAAVYQILRPVQGLAVPVFLGTINLNEGFEHFLYGTQRIRHMLVLSWGGEVIEKTGIDPVTRQKSVAESLEWINSLGVIHQDLHPANILWNAELNRVMIIDFNICEVEPDVAETMNVPRRPVGVDSMWCPYHGVLP